MRECDDEINLLTFFYLVPGDFINFPGLVPFLIIILLFKLKPDFIVL